MANPFTDHPATVGESYLEHMGSLEKLQSPSAGERMKSAIHGGVKSARDHHQAKANEALQQQLAAEKELQCLHPLAVEAGVPSAVALEHLQMEIHALQQKADGLKARGSLDLGLGPDQISQGVANDIVNQHLGDLPAAQPTFEEVASINLPEEAKAAAAKKLDRKCGPDELKQLQRGLLGQLAHSAAQPQIQAMQKQAEEKANKQRERKSSIEILTHIFLSRSV